MKKKVKTIVHQFLLAIASKGYKAMKKKHSPEEIQSWRMKGGQATKRLFQRKKAAKVWGQQFESLGKGWKSVKFKLNVKTK